jgi:hypothetical protein
VAPFCVTTNPRWPASQPPPQVLLLRILAAKDAKFVTGGIDFGSRSGATKFLVNVLELRGVRDVVQPFPSIRHFLFTTSLLPSEMEDLGIRSGVLRLGPGLGFDIRAVPLHRSRWVPFVVEGVVGKVDEDKLLEAIGDLRGVKSVSEDLRHLEDRLGVRDGRMQGKLKFLEDDECSGDDTTVLRKWKKSHFTHTVEVDGVDYVLTSLPPCYVCGSSAHAKSDCTIPAAIKKAPLFEITQTKAPAEEEVKVVEVAAQQPVDQPVASTSAPPKSRKRKTDNNVDADEVVCGHRLNAII